MKINWKLIYYIRLENQHHIINEILAIEKFGNQNNT